MKTIFIEKENYYYEGEVYNEKNVDTLIDRIGKKIKVIIIGENILINKVFERYSSIEKTLIAYDINNLESIDTLLDYNYDFKRKALYIYSIKQGKKVSRVIGKVKKLVVVPVQIIIKKTLKSIVKIKDYQGIIWIDKYVYVLQVENDIITLANTYEKNKFDFNICVDIFKSKGEIFTNEEMVSKESFIEDNKKIKLIDFNIKELQYEKK